nr:tetratricopeptide repeat protein [Streptomyces sp. NBC_00899]
MAIGVAVVNDSRDVGRELKRNPWRVMTARDRLWCEEEQDEDARKLRITAVWRRRNWKASGAVEPYEQLVAVRAAAWGADHPLVLDTRLALAAVRAEAGDVGGAAAAYEGLAADMVRVLGADHPRLPWVRRNLAHWRARTAWAAPPPPRMSELEGPALGEVLIREPHDTAVLRNLAQVRWNQGDEVGAVEAYERLLARRARERGADHDVTLVTRLTLAGMRAEGGDVAGALAAYASLAADMARTLGEDHRGTRGARHRLALWRGEPAQT